MFTRATSTAIFVLLATAGLALIYAPEQRARAEGLPHIHTESGHSGSKRCRSCHEKQYASWHKSFHRTMTTAASAGALKAPLETRRFTWRGMDSSLTVVNGAFVADFVSPFWLRMMAKVTKTPEQVPGQQRIKAAVAMVTGSHHQQVLWVKDPETSAYAAFPWVWNIVESRWIPNEVSFLQPPDTTAGVASEWSEQCLGCHATAGQPRIDSNKQTASPHVAELGIACEACHGGGAPHVADNRNPVRRYTKHLGDDGDNTVVNPAKLDHKRSTEVCGRCHSVWREKDWREYEIRGHTFKPGDQLGDHARIVQLPGANEKPQPWLLQWLRGNNVSGHFWADGTIRVAGREYNGLLETACYQRGEMSCLTCHSMHEYEAPADQVRKDKSADEICVECHKEIGADVASHTHHKEESSGSRCQNCHMPHTTYGLFKAIRSHRITSPAPAAEAAIGKPNACNLCHLDQSAQWAEAAVATWQGRAPSPINGIGEDMPQAALFLLAGDASQRALAAWAMRWPPALSASGTWWQPGLLAYLLADPYAAVRLVAGRALREHDAFSDLLHDFVQPPSQQSREVAEALRRWASSPKDVTVSGALPALFQSDGTARRGVIGAFLRRRNDTPISIQE